MTKTANIAGLATAALFTMFAMAMPAFAAAPLWDVSGSWVVDFDYLAGTYPHDMTLTQNGAGGLTGGGGYLAGATHTYEWVIDSGIVDGNTIHLETHYTLGAACTMTINGVVAANGSMSGTWSDDCDGARGGTWSTSSGQADLIPVVVPVATTKAQCKNGGWMNVTNANGNPFKNQGQCVSSTVPADKDNGGGPAPV